MLLQELVADIPCKVIRGKRVVIEGIAFDSREVKKGYIFVALSERGELYIDEAIKRGAGAIAGRNLKQIGVPFVLTPHPRQFLATISKRFYSYPDKRIELIGITGTNGKTTTSYLLKTILETAGYKAGIIGTLGYFTGKRLIQGINTTPESLVIIKLLKEMIDNGMKYAILEVSSHALSMDRVYGLSFRQAAFTNLSQDHLDFHKTMEDYKAAKLKLFENLKRDSFAVLNSDDPVSREVKTEAKKVFYGIEGRADIRATLIKPREEGMLVELNMDGDIIRVDFPLIGRYNLYNLACAAAMAHILKIPLDRIKEGAENFKNPKGRMERIIAPKGYSVYIDYAHTPNALKNALLALKGVKKGRLILVFGCGGDRDKKKRPEMGRIATEYGDYVIITSDNPRGEPPQEIIRDIEKGALRNNYEILIDRREAICRALEEAERDDIVLIAGKGHERYQVIRDKRIPFNDGEVVRRCLQQMS